MLAWLRYRGLETIQHRYTGMRRVSRALLCITVGVFKLERVARVGSLVAFLLVESDGVLLLLLFPVAVVSANRRVSRSGFRADARPSKDGVIENFSGFLLRLVTAFFILLLEPFLFDCYIGWTLGVLRPLSSMGQLGEFILEEVVASQRLELVPVAFDVRAHSFRVVKTLRDDLTPGNASILFIDRSLHPHDMRHIFPLLNLNR